MADTIYLDGEAEPVLEYEVLLTSDIRFSYLDATAEPVIELTGLWE